MERRAIVAAARSVGEALRRKTPLEKPLRRFMLEVLTTNRFSDKSVNQAFAACSTAWSTLQAGEHLYQCQLEKLSKYISKITRGAMLTERAG